MIISDDIKLDFDDILLVPQRSPHASRSNVSINRKFKFFYSDKEWDGVPVIAANMDTVGTFNMSNALSKHNMITCLHKHYSLEELMNIYKTISTYNCWISIGMKEEDNNKLSYLVEQIGTVPNICIDIANGYTEKFVNYCAKIRKQYGNEMILMAGNVCTPEMTQELILHGGVDIVKIGIGPGSACTTRLITGVGYPQLSAIIECSQVAHGLKSDSKRLGLICADGGCRTPSDICKAFAAGADFVMVGGMFAGTDECEGDWEYCTGGYKTKLKFYGMSSEEAQNKYNGGLASYKASEGRVELINYKGSVDKVVQQIKGGLVSCCTYLGADSLKDLPKCAKAIRVNRTHFKTNV